jgi:hypothetical protein
VRAIAVLALMVGLAGCATHHQPVVGDHYALGPKFWMCDDQGQNCRITQNVNPDMTWPHKGNQTQLTPAGCVLHRIVTFGHVAQECKKVKQ